MQSRDITSIGSFFAVGHVQARPLSTEDGNLDADTADEITAVSKERAHAFGKCVAVVTHSADVARQADVVLEIKRGREAGYL